VVAVTAIAAGGSFRPRYRALGRRGANGFAVASVLGLGDRAATASADSMFMGARLGKAGQGMQAKTRRSPTAAQTNSMEWPAIGRIASEAYQCVAIAALWGRSKARANSAARLADSRRENAECNRHGEKTEPRPNEVLLGWF